MHPDKALYVFISSICELSDPTPRHAPSIRLCASASSSPNFVRLESNLKSESSIGITRSSTSDGDRFIARSRRNRNMSEALTTCEFALSSFLDHEALGLWVGLPDLVNVAEEHEG